MKNVATSNGRLSVQMFAMGTALAVHGPVFSQEVADAGLSYGLEAELRYDDNIFRSESRKTDSFIVEGSPFVKATFFNQGNTYQLGYRLNYAEYLSSSEDSYNDHEFSVDVNHRFTTRQAVVATIEHRLLTEQRGTGFSEEPNDLVSGPDDYDHTSYGLTYLLGANDARARVELSARREDLSFDSSYVGDTRDYSADQLGALLRYRVGGRTDLLAEYRNLDVTYDNTPLDFNGQPIDLDSDEDYYLVGVAWELTAKTRGEVKVGRSSRDYDGDGFSGSTAHWEAELEWRPKSYSTLVLNTKRESLETNGAGFFIDTREHSLAWNHSWNSFLASRLLGGLAEDTYEDGNRKDDQLFWEASMFYDMSNWLDLSFGYRYRENDSSFDLVNYEQNIVFVRASVEL